MFARRLNVFMSGGALATAAAIVPIIGGACNCPDGLGSGCSDWPSDLFSVVASGGNVVPATADTSPKASAHLNVGTFEYTYSVAVPQSGTVDSVALYEVAPGDTLPASATTILCAGAASCALGFGTATAVAPATMVTIRNSMRAYGTQLVIFTTTAQKAAGGAMRGTMYVNP